MVAVLGFEHAFAAPHVLGVRVRVRVRVPMLLGIVFA
jgi:hypothetical protein